MTMKMVDGVEVPCTDDDLAALAADAARPAPVPAEVSAAQARVALRRAGLLSAVESAVASADPEVSDAWEYATVLRRDSAHVTSIAAAAGLTGAQLDELFRAAAAVEF